MGLLGRNISGHFHYFTNATHKNVILIKFITVTVDLTSEIAWLYNVLTPNRLDIKS